MKTESTQNTDYLFSFVVFEYILFSPRDCGLTETPEFSKIDEREDGRQPSRFQNHGFRQDTNPKSRIRQEMTITKLQQHLSICSNMDYLFLHLVHRYQPTDVISISASSDVANSSI